MTIEVPAELAEAQLRYNGEAGREFIAGLPDQAARYLTEWELRRDGPALHGMASLVLPVVRADGTPAALKLQILDEETESEPIGLRAWAGDGAVRLLDADDATGVMLLERLRPRSLSSVADDVEALKSLTALLARLVTHPAPQGIRSLEGIARAMLADVREAARLLPDDERRLVLDCAAAVADLVDEPGDRLLHWDLHYDNVLAADREPWLAIDPKPLAGDPGFDLMPALDNRWDDIAASGDVARAVRYRFDLMTEMLSLDRRRAAGWTLGRALQNTLWDLEDGEPGMSSRQRAIAEAIMPRWTGR
ncbi:aminoglycoside/hydroxyurea antibiotic resistance kinase family protein [Nocardia nova SH22a]|uniref:Aminoglycoside/hydroxyurea antibiotic resistance kinase family protein n=1 Tax=Nocardia nova SH22a TaxID=1415166 RepID=W5TQS0_9NOCA|nr:aminoglycoside phosphotransferase family protein [Nocardia nova]AHH21464.1 aminoglycoside/hydroxyurea antibiotic resistance kinase family protein [Nocardia nova SH22a]